MGEGEKSFEAALRNAWSRLRKVWLEMFAAQSPRPGGLESPVSFTCSGRCQLEDEALQVHKIEAEVEVVIVVGVGVVDMLVSAER